MPLKTSRVLPPGRACVLASEDGNLPPPGSMRLLASERSRILPAGYMRLLPSGSMAVLPPGYVTIPLVSGVVAFIRPPIWIVTPVRAIWIYIIGGDRDGTQKTSNI